MRIVGEPRKSPCFAGMRPFVRRSIAVRPDPIGPSAAQATAARRPLQSQPGGRCRISRSRLTPAWPATPSRPVHSRSRQADPVSGLCPGRPLSCGRRSSPGQFQASGRHRRRRAGTGQGVPLWSRHAGRIADRVRPDRTGQDRQILCAGGGQRPAAAAGARIRRGRPHRLRPVAGARKPSRTAARDRRGQCRRCAAMPSRADAGVHAAGQEAGDRDRSRPWRRRQRHPGRRRRHHGKESGAGLWPGAARPDREIGQVSRRHDPRRTTPSFRSATA